jgi:ubiquinone/menaquinone biosynthesis C-methylase UbiE
MNNVHITEGDMIKNNTAPYKPLESLFYDRVIAPAVIERSHLLKDNLIRIMKENSYVLDVGCGGGQLSLELARSRPDIKITGLDLSNEQIRRANERSAQSGNSAQYIQGSALSIPMEKNIFDLVYSVGSIKHWPDPVKGLKECVRVLKKGGLLLVIEVDKLCSDYEARRFTGNWRLPAVLKPLAKKFFLRYVSGRSFSVEDVKWMIKGLNLKESNVAVVPDNISWMLMGIKG